MFYKLGISLITNIFTAEVVSKITVMLLKKAAERTENTVDDEVIKIVEDRLKGNTA